MPWGRGTVEVRAAMGECRCASSASGRRKRRAHHTFLVPILILTIHPLHVTSKELNV